jgi:hypothetical protein
MVVVLVPIRDPRVRVVTLDAVADVPILIVCVALAPIAEPIEIVLLAVD